jgi:hypothetical protein
MNVGRRGSAARVGGGRPGVRAPGSGQGNTGSVASDHVNPALV